VVNFLTCGSSCCDTSCVMRAAVKHCSGAAVQLQQHLLSSCWRSLQHHWQETLQQSRLADSGLEFCDSRDFKESLKAKLMQHSPASWVWLLSKSYASAGLAVLISLLLCSFESGQRLGLGCLSDCTIRG
jgi:hypothetical protein